MTLLSSSTHNESNEIQNKKHNFVIVWFGDLWKWWHQLLTEAWQNVYVCSLHWRKYDDDYSKSHNIQSYNAFKLPISYDDIDVVLICCTATDIDLLKECLPKKLIEQKANQFVFFQNGIWIRDKIKNILSNTQHPTQVIPYFSFKTNGWSKVTIKFAKPCPATGDDITLKTLVEATNKWPHQSILFEWVDSIILRKEERKKWYVNSFLNTICVLYDAPVEKAVKEFKQEFWDNAQRQIYYELTTFNNDIAWDDLAHMEKEEIQEDIENAIQAFKDLYPSTYFQYYRNRWEVQQIHSDEQHFIGKIIQICDIKWKKLPLLETLYNRMKALKTKLESSA